MSTRLDVWGAADVTEYAGPCADGLYIQITSLDGECEYMQGPKRELLLILLNPPCERCAGPYLQHREPHGYEPTARLRDIPELAEIFARPITGVP